MNKNTLRTHKILIPEKVEFELKREGSNSYLELKFPSFKKVLKYDWCVLEKEEKNLKITYPKRCNKKIKSVIGTWTNLIKKYEEEPVFEYTITPCSTHFPISVKIKEENTLEIFNYMGLKKSFYISFSFIESMTMENKTITIKTKNDQITGSQLNKLKQIRYHTAQKNLDRRRFLDGFLIKKKKL